MAPDSLPSKWFNFSVSQRWRRVVIDRSGEPIAELTEEASHIIDRQHQDTQELLSIIHANGLFIRCSCTPANPVSHIVHSTHYFWRKNLGADNLHDIDCALFHDTGQRIKAKSLAFTSRKPVNLFPVNKIEQKGGAGAVGSSGQGSRVSQLAKVLARLLTDSGYNVWMPGKQYSITNLIAAASTIELVPGVKADTMFTGRNDLMGMISTKLRKSDDWPETQEPHFLALLNLTEIDLESKSITTQALKDNKASTITVRERPIPLFDSSVQNGPYLGLLACKLDGDGYKAIRVVYVPVAGQYSLIPVASSQERWLFHAVRKAIKRIGADREVGIEIERPLVTDNTLACGCNFAMKLKGPEYSVAFVLTDSACQNWSVNAEDFEVVHVEMNGFDKAAIERRYKRVYWGASKALQSGGLSGEE